MKTRMFRKENLSLLGFGCMRMPETAPGCIDREKAFEMLDAAYDAGVNYYDTAYPYHAGDSEVMLGEWLRTKPRESLYVASKFPVWKANCREDFFTIFEEQRKKLGVETIDFYLLHALNAQREEALLQWNLFAAAEELRAQGKIRYLGFSFHDEYPVFERLLERADWDFCQLQLNYMDTEVQAGIRGYQLAAEKGIPVMVMEPVKGGSLANPPQDVKKVFEALHPDWSGASWALRWVASLENVAVILSGMSTLQQVQDNLNTFATVEPLNEDEKRAVEQAAAIYRSRVRVPCTGCAYCMPCPAGVNIPEIFKIYNHASVYDMQQQGKGNYRQLDDQQKAAQCVKCGKCVKACPQNIAIPDRMTQINEWANG